MDKVVLQARAPAKINLFLHVTGRRTDGYHLLESLFCPVSLYDDIELTLQQQAHQSGLQLVREGVLAALPETVDLTARACKAFFAHPSLPDHWQIQIKVTKNIPDQAGMGGGSSDAATVLTLLQDHFNHPWSNHELAQLALSLGADVPFFLQRNSAFVEGIGETLAPFPGLKGHVVVYKPPQNCPTGKIFSSGELTRDTSTVKIAVFDSGRLAKGSETVGLQLWKYLREHTHNGLQKVVEALQPDWLEQFQIFGKQVETHSPLLVRMTGSGSAMFAVFEHPDQAASAAQRVTQLYGLVFECDLL